MGDRGHFLITSTNHHNCFIALPRAVASRMPKSESVYVIKVTPAHENKSKASSMYFSWSWTTTADNSVGVPHSLLQGLSLKVGDKVRVECQGGTPLASEVHVEPYSVDDSEILECSQEEVAQAVPHQLHVAYPGLVFPVYVYQAICIRLIVKSVRVRGSGKASVGRIADGTEMIVECKTRSGQVADSEPPEPGILRIVPNPVPESKSTPAQPTLYVGGDVLKTLRWKTGMQMAVLSLSDIADGMVKARVARKSQRDGSAGASTNDESKSLAVQVKGSAALARRSRVYQLQKWPDKWGSLPEAAAAVLEPNPFRDYTCISAASAEPDKDNHYCTDFQPFNQQNRSFSFYDMNTVYPNETRQCMEILHLPYTHSAVIDAMFGSKLHSGLPGTSRGDVCLHSGLGTHRQSLVITGSKGCGKTSMAQALGQASNRFVVYVPCLTIASQNKADHSVLQSLKDALLEAQVHVPSVLVLDDLHLIMAADNKSGSPNPKVAQQCSLLIDLIRQAAGSIPLTSAPQKSGSSHGAIGTSIIITTTSFEALHEGIAQCLVTTDVVSLPLPSPGQRTKIFTLVAKQQQLVLSHETKDYVARNTHNYTPLDIVNLMGRAAQNQIIDDVLGDAKGRPGVEHELSLSTFQATLRNFVPICYEGIQLLKPDANLSQAGGMKDAIDLLYETLIMPNKYPSLFKRLPTALRSGVLLYGPPGCGKTHIIRCVLGEAGLNCIAVSGPELLNKYIGASELRVRELFAKAAAAKPSVVFFDEFDSIAPKRGHDSTGVTDRVVNQLLCHLDGVEDRTGIYVVAATSRPDLIDPALLRPGRLDKHIHCTMPTLEERVDILETISRDCPMEDAVDFDEVAEWCDNFTAADLSGLMATAQLEAIHSLLTPSTDPTDAAKPDQEEDVEAGPAPVCHNLDSLNIDQRTALQRRVGRLCAPISKEGPALESKAKGGVKVNQEQLRRAYEQTRPCLSRQAIQFYHQIYTAFAAPKGKVSGEKRATHA